MEYLSHLILGNRVSASHKICTNQTLPDKKLFYHEGEKVEINLLSSGSQESRLIAAVFQTLSREVLGYDVNVLVEDNLDKDEAFNILSSCNSPL